MKTRQPPHWPSVIRELKALGWTTDTLEAHTKVRRRTIYDLASGRTKHSAAGLPLVELLAYEKAEIVKEEAALHARIAELEAEVARWKRCYPQMSPL